MQTSISSEFHPNWPAATQQRSQVEQHGAVYRVLWLAWNLQLFDSNSLASPPSAIDNSVAACAHGVLTPRGGLEFSQVHVSEHHLFTIDDVVKSTQGGVDHVKTNTLGSKLYTDLSRKKTSHETPRESRRGRHAACDEVIFQQSFQRPQRGRRC